MFDTFSSEYYHILAIKMLHMLIVIVFWGREVRRIGDYLRGSPWKWLNMSTRATNMACVVGMAKRVYSDFPVFGITGFLGCKKQRQISYLSLGPEIQVEVPSFWQVTNHSINPC